jgi:hypothetical protein
MITQLPGETCGCTQFQGQRALPARPVERLAEMALGCGHCSGFGSHEQKLSPDAKRLRKQPASTCTLGSFRCLLDGGEPLGDLLGASKTCRHFVGDYQRMHQSAEFVETAKQLPQPRTGVAVPGIDHLLKGPTHGTPGRQSAPRRMVEKHCDVTLCGSKIADPKHDRTGRSAPVRNAATPRD